MNEPFAAKIPVARHFQFTHGVGFNTHITLRCLRLRGVCRCWCGGRTGLAQPLLNQFCNGRRTSAFAAFAHFSVEFLASCSGMLMLMIRRSPARCLAMKKSHSRHLINMSPTVNQRCSTSDNGLQNPQGRAFRASCSPSPASRRTRPTPRPAALVPRRGTTDGCRKNGRRLGCCPNPRRRYR